uniref:Plastocyanin-like domain-containing protein n=1 Tax=Brassica oleracea var. oleracea TaxID=109376 RepID=A0A0D3DVT3_BRAOL
VNWCVLKRLNQGARKKLDFARNIPFPDDLLIDDPSKSVTFTGQLSSLYQVSNGNIYRFWIMSVGILTSINFGIQGHMITLVEVEGSHTLEEVYESLDIHIGQSLTVLVTLKALA